MDHELKEKLTNGIAKGLPLDFGMHAVEMEEGHVRLEMEIADKHRNIYGMVHGGTMYALADTATGFCARTFGSRVVTLNGSMNYLKGSPKTTRIYCDADVVRRGRSVIVVDAKVYDEFDLLMANGSYTLYVLKDQA